MKCEYLQNWDAKDDELRENSIKNRLGFKGRLTREGLENFCVEALPVQLFVLDKAC